MALRVVFMGTLDFAVPPLVEIIGQGHEVAAAYTRAPRPAGRGMAERLSAVHEKAAAFGIEVRTLATLRDAAEQAAFAALEADVAVVVAYGLILPRPVLEAPREGCINVHASLLPRWRGAAPIQRAIMAGDVETGVMIMRMEEGLDTGPVCMAERAAIRPGETAGALHDRLALLGADLVVRALGAIERGRLSCVPQAEAGAVYAAKIDKAEARIDWRKPARDVINLIHGLSPFPGAWFQVRLGGNPERVKVLRAEDASVLGDDAPPGTLLPGHDLVVACADGAVRLTELQRAGKRPMPADAFRRGVTGVPEIEP